MTTRLVAVSLICFFALRAPAVAAEPGPVPWLPQESWPGGKQYDARLDKSVTLWVTGAPLAQVFASLQQQTGVALGFFPADDDNARICVNVYLNPKRPPTLRDLLAQLAWVLDCNFGSTGEGEGRTYTLLSTSIGSDVVARLQEEKRALSERQDRDWQAVEKELHRRALEKLSELREALTLSREEAIRKYRGEDDLLLLTVLEPETRLAAQVMLDVTADGLGSLEQGYGREWKWSELTPEQRALLRQALVSYQARYRDMQSGVAPAEVPDSAPLTLEVWPNYNGFTVALRPPRGERGLSQHGEGSRPHWPSLNTTLGLVQGIRDIDPDQGPYADIEIRQLLGEPISDEQRRKLFEETDTRWRAELGRREVARRLEERRPALQAATRQALAALPWSFGIEQPYTLWQVQEAVAAASGMHIVSDCFWQPPRALKEMAPAGRALSLLDVLRLSSFARADRGSLLDIWSPSSAADSSGWEWGDAGSFLRFRSRDRDLMRAGLLPRQAAEKLDAWLEPHLPAAPVDPRKLPKVTAPLDIRECGRLSLQLTLLQTRWGADLVYGDPSDWKEAYRQAFRSSVLRLTGGAQRVAYRIIGSLSDRLWARLNEEGIRWEEDFTFHDSEEERTLGVVWSGDDRKGDLYRIVDWKTDPRVVEEVNRRHLQEPPHRMFKARVGRENEGAWEAWLALDASMEPRLPKHLVTPPEDRP